MSTTPAEAYNYDVFDPAPYVATHCDGPTVGDHLGDAALTRVDGTPVTPDALGPGLVVMETGSTTCPLYRGNVPRMRQVADAHPGVTFVMLYTREAHPGEHRGAHADIGDKRAAAATLPDAAGEWRTVLVDDLDGTLHRRLGAAPDSVTILDGDGTVLAYFHDSDPAAVDHALRRLRDGRSVDGIRARFLPPPPPTALRALRTGGWQAVRDFVRSMPALARYRVRGGAPC